MERFRGYLTFVASAAKNKPANLSTVPRVNLVSRRQYSGHFYAVHYFEASPGVAARLHLTAATRHNQRPMRSNLKRTAKGCEQGSIDPISPRGCIRHVARSRCRHSACLYRRFYAYRSFISILSGANAAENEFFTSLARMIVYTRSNPINFALCVFLRS